MKNLKLGDKRKSSFKIIFLGIFMIGLLFFDKQKVIAEENEIIGSGELTAEWVNLGLNWEMTGGTAGRVVKGETFDVYERKLTDTGYKYRVYAHNAKIYGYISSRFINFYPSVEYTSSEKVIGKGKLVASWVNLGLNWEMTGGTAGRVVKGEIFDVYERKLTDTGYRYRVYAHNAGVYGFISGRFLEFTPTKDYQEEKADIIGYATLTAKWVNLGLNWEMTGGTAGRVVKGETFDVYARKLTDTGYKYYVYAHTAGVYGFISGRFVEYEPLKEYENANVSIDRNELFQNYTEHLNNSDFENRVNEYAQKGWDVLAASNRGGGLSAYFTVLANGVLDFTFSEIGSYFGLSMSYEEKMRYETIQQLMGNICDEGSGIYNASDKVTTSMDNLETALELELEVSDATYKKVISEVFSELNESELDDILKHAHNTYDKIANRAARIINFSTFLFSSIQFYQVEVSMIDQMLERVDKDSSLYQDLLLLRQEITLDTVEYVKKYYISEEVWNGILDLLSMSSKVSLVQLTDLGMSVVANVLCRGITADEYIQATYLGTYMNTLHLEVEKMQVNLWMKTMQGEMLTEKEISNYEFMVKVYLKSVEVFLEHAQEFGKSKEIQNCIDSLQKDYNYEKYISSCISNAQSAQ